MAEETEPEGPPLLVERRGRVEVLTLNRPERRNAWTIELASSLREAVSAAGRDPEVGAIVLRGAGGAFSAGADLKQGFGEGEIGDAVTERLRAHYNPTIAAVRGCPRPVVAAVRGPAVGIGISLAIACDLVVAGRSAVFGLAFIRIGLMPDGGCTALLTPLVGRARATELALLGDPVPASEAAEIGLVNKVVDDDRAESEAFELAEKLAAGPPLAIAETKRAIDRAANRHLGDLMELEAEAQGRLARSRDAAEGIAAFLERRPARFEGR